MKHACVFILRGEEHHPLQKLCLHMFELFFTVVCLFVLVAVVSFIPSLVLRLFIVKI